MTKTQTFTLLLLILAILAAGALLTYQLVHSAQAVLGPYTPQPVAVITLTPGRNPTRTVIPTWTLTPSPSPTLRPPTSTPIPTRTPTPTITPTPLPSHRPTAVNFAITATPHPSETVAFPTAVPRFHIPADAITIALLGSDKRPDWGYWNTDAIQYLVIYPDVPSVALLSIPRDLYVYIPGYKMARINTADSYGEMIGFEGGGIGLLNQTLLHNLGITADYYVKVDFNGLIGLVNLMGGVDVPVNCHLEDYWPYPDENGEYPWLVLEPGVTHMDGELALWYSRSRKTTSVFSRERRQQQVLEAMWRRGREMNLIEVAPGLFTETRDLYQTDLNVGNILQLAITAMQVNAADVSRYNIGYQQVNSFVTYQGGSVFLPVWEEIEPVIADTIAKPAASRAYQSPVYVEIWNGTGRPGWEHLAADRMLHYGFIPHITGGDGQIYERTTIVTLNNTGKGTNLSLLQWLFNVGDGNVMGAEVPGTSVHLRLILGQNYDPCR